MLSKKFQKTLTHSTVKEADGSTKMAKIKYSKYNKLYTKNAKSKASVQSYLDTDS